MSNECKKNFEKANELSDQLIKLATDGYEKCDDDKCAVLYGIILDSGYKLRMEIQKRLEELELNPHAVEKKTT